MVVWVYYGPSLWQSWARTNPKTAKSYQKKNGFTLKQVWIAVQTQRYHSNLSRFLYQPQFLEFSHTLEGHPDFSRILGPPHRPLWPKLGLLDLDDRNPVLHERSDELPNQIGNFTHPSPDESNTLFVSRTATWALYHTSSSGSWVSSSAPSPTSSSSGSTPPLVPPGKFSTPSVSWFLQSL